MQGSMMQQDPQAALHGRKCCSRLMAQRETALLGAPSMMRLSPSGGHLWATVLALPSGHTHLGPGVPLDPVLVVGTASLEHGLLCATTARHLAHSGSAGAGQHLQQSDDGASTSPPGIPPG